jgi:hypothetical protein
MFHARSWALALIVLVAAWGGTMCSSAQAVDGLVPSAITSEAFDRWVSRLGFNHAGRVAVEAAHERYKLSYRRFRDTEISEAVAEQEHRRPVTWEATAPLREQLMESLRSLDARLMLDLQAALGPQHHPAIQALELVSIRRYARFGLYEAGSGEPGRPDLSRLARSQLETIDPRLDALLLDYEAAVAPLEQEYRAAYDEWRRGRDEAMAVHGYEGPDGGRRIAEEDLESADLNTFPRLIAAEEALRALNVEWAGVIERALPRDSQAPFHFESRSRLWVDALPPTQRPSIDVWGAYLHNVEAVDPEGRALLEDRFAKFLSEWDGLVEDARPLVDQYQALRLSSGQREPHAPELARELERLANAFIDVQVKWGESIYAAAAQHRLPEHAARLSGQSSMFARPLSAEQFEWIIGLLELDEPAAAVARHFYDEYLQTCWQIEQVKRDRAGSLPRSPPPSPEDRLAHAVRMREARRNVFAELERLDRQLIRDLVALSSREDREIEGIIAAERARERVNIGRGWSAEVELGMPDAVHIARRTLPEQAITDQIAGLMHGAHEATLALLVERHRLACDAGVASAERAIIRDRAERLGGGGDHGGGSRDSAIDSIELLARRFVDHSLRFVEEVREALPPPWDQRFHDAFLAAAYPHAYGVTDRAAASAKQALLLESLTAEQKRSIMEAIDQHAARWREIADGLKQAQISGRTVFTRSVDDIEMLPPFHERGGALLFDRTELAATTLRRVRALLTAEQAAEWDARVATQQD